MSNNSQYKYFSFFHFAAVILTVFTFWMAGRLNPVSSLIVPTESSTTHAYAILDYGEASPPLVHYTEHLAWLNAVGHERGADRHSNAWTNNYTVGYWLSGAPEDLPDLLKTLSGVFDPIDLPRSFAEEEREIVLREYEFRMSNNPDARAAEKMEAFLYAGNSIAVSVIGTPEQIMALDYDAARALHAVTHVPQNARLVVIGDVSAREVRRAMRQAGWPETESDQTDIAPPTFALSAAATRDLRYPEPDTATRLIWRRVVTLPEPVPFDLLEAQTVLLRDILDTNLPGGLAGPLRYDAAIARSFDVQVWPLDEDNVELSFTAAPDVGVSLRELQAAFEATVAEIAQKGVPDETYSRVLKRFENFWPDWDDAQNTARWVSNYTLDRVSQLRSPLTKRQIKHLHGDLSLETTNALLRQLAEEGRTARAFIGPEESFE